MNDMKSFKTISPVIDRITFRKPGFMNVSLQDGRMLLVPLGNFPGISSLTSEQRRRYSIIDDTILMFRDDDEVYHIQDFLGTYDTNSYKSPGAKQNRELVTA